jgi:hypothetical protein
MGEVFCVFHVPGDAQTPQKHSVSVLFVDSFDVGGEHVLAPCLGLGFVGDDT